MIVDWEARLGTLEYDWDDHGYPGESVGLNVDQLIRRSRGPLSRRMIESEDEEDEEEGEEGEDD